MILKYTYWLSNKCSPQRFIVVYDESDFYGHFQQQDSINLLIVTSIIHDQNHIMTN